MTIADQIASSVWEALLFGRRLCAHGRAHLCGVALLAYSPPSRSPARHGRLGRMKVSCRWTLEGVAGIVDWAQCLATGDDYRLGRDLLIGEVNAAIDGAQAAGATDILVNDAHSFMRNLPPAELSGRAAYLSGRFKPLYMMEGLDSSFQAAVFLGYHAAIETRASCRTPTTPAPSRAFASTARSPARQA
jgi:hypothetical protein